jgi:hypothetical protein
MPPSTPLQKQECRATAARIAPQARTIIIGNDKRTARRVLQKRGDAMADVAPTRLRHVSQRLVQPVLFFMSGLRTVSESLAQARGVCDFMRQQISQCCAVWQRRVQVEHVATIAEGLGPLWLKVATPDHATERGPSALQPRQPRSQQHRQPTIAIDVEERTELNLDSWHNLEFQLLQQFVHAQTRSLVRGDLLVHEDANTLASSPGTRGDLGILLRIIERPVRHV